MKHRRLFEIALLFPYLFWGIGVLIIYSLTQQDISENWNLVLLPITFYVIGAIFWFIPYTLLAIGMWIWGKNKSVTSLHRAGILAPLLFSFLMIINYLIYTLLLVSGESSTISFITINWNEIIRFMVILITISLIVGYLFVGIALAIYQLLQSKNLFTEDVKS